jgi:hypothetical protein
LTGKEELLMTTTSTSNSSVTNLHFKKLMDAMERIIKEKCPIARWMEKEGFSPDDGGLMLVDEHTWETMGGGEPPPYVMINENPARAGIVLCRTGQRAGDFKNLEPINIKENKDGGEEDKG